MADVVSVDLASREAGSIGIALLSRRGADIVCRRSSLRCSAAHLDAGRVATQLHALCEREGARLLLLDGPQAWKSPRQRRYGYRVCENEVPGTVAQFKTGLPGVVLPVTASRFTTFSICVFDALMSLGWSLLDQTTMPAAPGRVVVESFPNCCWRSLRLPRLPGKARATTADIVAAKERLADAVRLKMVGTPTHDQLQAAIAGVGGLALLEGRVDDYGLAGVPPSKIHEIWREGYIVFPR